MNPEFRLAIFTGNKEYKKRGDKILAAFSSLFESNPSIVSNMITAFDFSLATHKEIVIVAPESNTRGNELFLKEFRNMYIPDRILIQVEQGEHASELSKLIPLIKGKTAIKNNNTAYVCEKGICYLPSFTAKEFLKQF